MLHTPPQPPSDWSSEDWDGDKAKAREQRSLIDFKLLANQVQEHNTRHNTKHIARQTRKGPDKWFRKPDTITRQDHPKYDRHIGPTTGHIRKEM